MFTKVHNFIVLHPVLNLRWIESAIITYIYASVLKLANPHLPLPLRIYAGSFKIIEGIYDNCFMFKHIIEPYRSLSSKKLWALDLMCHEVIQYFIV